VLHRGTCKLLPHDYALDLRYAMGPTALKPHYRWRIVHAKLGRSDGDPREREMRAAHWDAKLRDAEGVREGDRGGAWGDKERQLSE
jgi:hypothetical protein